MPEPGVGESVPRRGSLWWYVPIVVVLVLGYGLGGALSFGTAFLGWFSLVSEPAGRLALQLFGMGMLGASLYCSRWWSVDHDEALSDRSVRPTALDWFGYATTITGGGITGVVLCLLLRYGVNLVSDANAASVRPGAALVVALMGGLFHFKVEALLAKLFRAVHDQATGATGGETKSSTDTSSSP